MPDPSQKSSLGEVVRYTHLAFVLPAAAVVGLLLGAAIDKWLGTDWVYLAGLVVGIVAGFYDLARAILKQSKEE